MNELEAWKADRRELLCHRALECVAGDTLAVHLDRFCAAGLNQALLDPICQNSRSMTCMHSADRYWTQPPMPRITTSTRSFQVYWLQIQSRIMLRTIVHEPIMPERLWYCDRSRLGSPLSAHIAVLSASICSLSECPPECPPDRPACTKESNVSPSPGSRLPVPRGSRDRT